MDMLEMFRKLIIGTVAATAAMALVTSPAQARDRRGNDAAVAVAAGVVGLAVGAAIASNRRDRYYYPDRYYSYNQPRYRGYYYDAYPQRRNYYRNYRTKSRPYRHYRDSPRYRQSYRNHGYRR